MSYIDLNIRLNASVQTNCDLMAEVWDLYGELSKPIKTIEGRHECECATGGIVGLQNVRGSLLVLRDALKAARDEMEGA